MALAVPWTPRACPVARCRFRDGSMNLSPIRAADPFASMKVGTVRLLKRYSLLGDRAFFGIDENQQRSAIRGRGAWIMVSPRREMAWADLMPGPRGGDRKS